MYKILIADDEPDVVSLIKDFFELEGYLVLTARDGAEAVAAVSKAPDLILLDINMPELDGLSVCRRIREEVSCPIIFLTARIEDHDKVEGFAAGGDDYVIKPFSLDELAARVAAHIRRDHREAKSGNRLVCGRLTIDYDSKQVTADGGARDHARERVARVSAPAARANRMDMPQRHVGVRDYLCSFRRADEV